MTNKKAKGKRAKTRHKLKNRDTKLTVNKLLGNFDLGTRVHIRANSSNHSGMPPRRFHGMTGVVKEKRGRAFLVELNLGRGTRQLVLGPAHLSAVKGEASA